MNFRIRRWRSGDQKAVIALVIAALREHRLWASHKHLMDDLASVRESYLERGGEFLVVELDGRVTGCGALLRRGRVFEIVRMYLEPAFRGRGLGRRLLARLEAAAAKAGAASLRLDTDRKLKKAIALYEASGYACVDRAGSGCCPLVFRKRL